MDLVRKTNGLRPADCCPYCTLAFCSVISISARGLITRCSRAVTGAQGQHHAPGSAVPVTLTPGTSCPLLCWALPGTPSVPHPGRGSCGVILRRHPLVHVCRVDVDSANPGDMIHFCCVLFALEPPRVSERRGAGRLSPGSPHEAKLCAICTTWKMRS